MTSAQGGASATENRPSETALAAAYQVTARWFANEQQLIWRRTSLFVTLNGLVVAILQFLPNLHASISLILPLMGSMYSVCWYFSMGRAWTYQSFLIAVMREQEEELQLGDLGPFTRGRRVSEKTDGEVIADQKIIFRPTTLLFRAKLLADAVTWLFALVYLAFFVLGILRLKASA